MTKKKGKKVAKKALAKISKAPKKVKKAVKKAIRNNKGDQLKITRKEVKNIVKKGGSKKQLKKLLKFSKNNKKLKMGGKVDSRKELRKILKKHGKRTNPNAPGLPVTYDPKEPITYQPVVGSPGRKSGFKNAIKRIKNKAEELYQERVNRKLPGHLGSYKKVDNYKETRKAMKQAGGNLDKLYGKKGRFKGGVVGDNTRLRVNKDGEFRKAEKGLKNDPYGTLTIGKTTEKYIDRRPKEKKKKFEDLKSKLTSSITAPKKTTDLQSRMKTSLSAVS